MKSTAVKQMKSLALAYIGDAVYELHIREHLIRSGQVTPNALHQPAVTFVSGKAQSAVVMAWLDGTCLTYEEERVVKRGSNAESGSVPKHTRVQSSRLSHTSA